MSGGETGLYRRGGGSDSTNLDVKMGFDEQQLLVQLSHMNLINRKGFILCHHSPVNANILLSLFPSQHITSRRTCTSRTARPAGRASPTASARPGEASERARVVHRPPLTSFTSGVHEVHPLSRLRSSSNPGTELSN